MIDGGVITDASPRTDSSLEPDALASLAWVDFSITGCDPVPDAGTGDAGAAPCRGTAPLDLRFTAIAPAPIEKYVWTFGDGADDSVAAPLHAYAEPGAYDVGLVVGGPGGTASVDKPGAVIVGPAQLSSSCATDAQCGELDCVCGAETTCTVSLAAGMCSAECDAESPCAAGVCADLAPAPPEEPEDWQRALCVAGCGADDACPGDLVCQDLRGPGDTGWVRGCFPAGVLAPIAASCVDAEGDPDDTACASGSCDALGARGYCTTDCTAGTCPDSAACATFAGGELGSICLARCSASVTCEGDPLLACETAGGEGALAFAVDEKPSAQGYCAPKTCTGKEPGECGVDGSCVDGFCQAD